MKPGNSDLGLDLGNRVRDRVRGKDRDNDIVSFRLGLVLGLGWDVPSVTV